jgi:hypothetical protein
MGAGAEAAGAVTKGGGFFSNLIKGGKGLLGKINPVMALKAATKEAGGFSKLLGKAVKGSALNTILTGFFAYNDIKDLVNNPVDENGKPLGEKAVNQKVGQIAAGGLGGILGGMIGTVVGGPIGAMVGSFGGEWLFKSLAEAFPEALEGLGGLISPLVKSKTELPKHAKGGIFTSASAGIIGEAGPEAVIPLTGFYNKIDQLITAVQVQKKEQAPRPVQQSVEPLTGFSNKIDQLIAAMQLQKKEQAPKPVQEITKPVQEITKPVQEITLPLTGFSNKIDQLITAMQLQKKEEVVKPVQEITLPLTGFSNKIDQLIAAMQLQKRTEVVKSNNLTDRPIPAPVAVPVAKPVQELKPLAIKEPAAPIIQPKPIVTREIQSTPNNTEIVGLLKELITATKQGKPVYLDSNRVNAALGQSMYTVGG